MNACCKHGGHSTGMEGTLQQRVSMEGTLQQQVLVQCVACIRPNAYHHCTDCALKPRWATARLSDKCQGKLAGVLERAPPTPLRPPVLRPPVLRPPALLCCTGAGGANACRLPCRRPRPPAAPCGTASRACAAREAGRTGKCPSTQVSLRCLAIRGCCSGPRARQGSRAGQPRSPPYFPSADPPRCFWRRHPVLAAPCEPQAGAARRVRHERVPTGLPRAELAGAAQVATPAGPQRAAAGLQGHAPPAAPAPSCAMRCRQ
jgi:hypothetical protein